MRFLRALAKRIRIVHAELTVKKRNMTLHYLRPIGLHNSIKYASIIHNRIRKILDVIYFTCSLTFDLSLQYLSICQNEAKKKYGTKQQNLDEFRNNFAQISVYFKSLNTKFITEQPKYSVSKSLLISCL